MTGIKYLSELNLTPNRFMASKVNIIECPTGAGKTHFSLYYLAQFTQNYNCMLYITDTLMNKAQIIKHYENTKEYDIKWRSLINKSTKNQIIQQTGRNWGSMKPKITAMTYAKVGAILANGYAFDWSKFDFIILDELHNLINFQNIVSKGNSANILALTKAKIDNTLYNYPDVKIIALTATPQKVKAKFINTYNVLYPQEYNELRQYETKERIVYSDYMELFNYIPLGLKGIIYFPQIRTLKKAEQYLISKGHKSLSIWSIANKQHTMTAEQINTRNYIIQNEKIPPNIEILLINSACETGINIKNTDISFMVIHSNDTDTQIQVRGRLRNDLNKCFYYLPTYQKPIIVPDEYLNRPLNTDEKKELCENVLRVWNKKLNQPYAWKGTKVYLENNGYDITDKTIKGKRTSTIEKLEE